MNEFNKKKVVLLRLFVQCIDLQYNKLQECFLVNYSFNK